MVNLDAIQWLKEIPVKNKNRIFIIDERSNTKITFGELDVNAKGIATILKNYGLAKGDHVAIMMENSVSIAVLYFGCLYSGIVVVPINASTITDEFYQIVQTSNSKAIFFSDSTIKTADISALKKLGILFFCFGKSAENNNSKEIIMLSSKFENSSDFSPFYDMNDDDVMSIMYSAGTTATPKAIVHRIKEFVQNARLFGNILGINRDNRFCNILSMTYLGGYYNLLMLPYILESSVVLIDSFDPKMAINFWESIIKNNVNTLWLVPSIMSMLLEIDRNENGKKYCRNNIKLCLSGTAPLPLSIRTEFEKKYGITVHQNYGLSETLFITTNSPKFPVIGDSVGKMLPGIRIRIVDKHGNKVANGEEGEILVQTPYLMNGYYNFEKLNINPISEKSWFETGDLGKLDNEYLFITGRKKDLIIRGGINISPVSIENLLYEHKSVLECAVVGIPNKFQGEEIIAVVRIADSKNFENIKNELYIMCKNKLSSIKHPTHIIELVEFPHSTYGKIQKNKIRSWIIQNQNKLMQRRKIISQKSLITTKQDYTHSRTVSQSIEALSIKYNTEVYEKQRKGEDIIVLSLGEAFFDIPLYKFDDLPYPKIYHYSHSRGIPELRQKISQYFSETYDVSFDYESEIIVTVGSKIGIFMSLMALLNPDDEVLIHEPAWVSFPEQVKLAHGNPIQIPYEKSVYDFEEYVTSKTKMIIINNPNNPTGKIYTLEELSYLYHLAKKYKLYVLSDEAYSDFVLNQDDFISFANLDVKKEHCIVVNSISKNFGISGWRLGYLITNAKLINQILKINQHLITCPATILEYYVAKYFNDIIQTTKPQITELVKKRKIIAEYMDSISLVYLPGNTTFYFFVSIYPSKLSSDDFCQKLLQLYGVSTVPGIGYGRSCEKFIRISIGSENMARIRNGLQIIKKLIVSTS